MSLLKPPVMISVIENRKFLCFKWTRKVWYIEWEFARLGPYYNKNEAYAEHYHALCAYRMTNEA